MSIQHSKSTPGRSWLILALVSLSIAPESVLAGWINPFHRSASSKVLTARDAPSWGFYDPSLDGGSWLTSVQNTFPAGLGEPLNAVISAWSDGDVLVDQQSNGGLRNYFQSLGFSGECLGQALGSKQAANLGDGHGLVNETAVMRWNYGDPFVGTCSETVEGGNHFRYWTQNGPDAKSGAVFLAVSYELPIDKGHDIVQNGYNLARDWLVGNATGQRIANPNPLSVATATTSQSSASATPTLNAAGGTGIITAVANGQFVGSTSANSYTYTTTVTYYTGLLGNTSVGINHYLSVQQDGRPAVDGLTAVLDVKITGRPSGSSAAFIVSLPSLISLNALLMVLSMVLTL